MTRYRHPTQRKSPYITADGLKSLQVEQEDLWKKRRTVVTALSAAAAEGDRSENAEYIYRKKQLREIDRRIRYLQKRIPELKPVAATPTRRNQVFFGAWVTLQDAAEEEVTYRIVGADEFDPKRQWISIDSPVAKALLKRLIEDEIQVETPSGSLTYWITEIRYS